MKNGEILALPDARRDPALCTEVSYRDFLDTPMILTLKGKAELIIAKQRNGQPE